jgi:MFS superfamily sulfate permease-like transporter
VDKAVAQNGAGLPHQAAVLPVALLKSYRRFWLPRYPSSWLRHDAIAGVTLAAYAIPVSLAYATLAGVPPHHWIYCYLMGGLGWICSFSTSRQLAVGPTSAIAILVGTTVAGMAGGDAARWTGIAALMALMVAILGLIAWAMRRAAWSTSLVRQFSLDSKLELL